MTVVIPTPEEDCPALDALVMEGVNELRPYLCVSAYDYGSIFADYWNAGEPFVVVEWDVVPWPGALESLWECDRGWCVYDYPLSPGNITRSFGIGKYRPQGKAPAEWAETRWDQLDGMVIPVLNRLYGRSHIHGPPVAHAKRNHNGADR